MGACFARAHQEWASHFAFASVASQGAAPLLRPVAVERAQPSPPGRNSCVVDARLACSHRHLRPVPGASLDPSILRPLHSLGLRRTARGACRRRGGDAVGAAGAVGYGVMPRFRRGLLLAGVAAAGVAAVRLAISAGAPAVPARIVGTGCRCGRGSTGCRTRRTSAGASACVSAAGTTSPATSAARAPSPGRRAL